VAWLSLDPADNDPARFLQYLSAALDILEPGLEDEVRPLLQTAEPPNGEAILTLVINRLSGLEEDAVLALDDYHLIENPAIHTALTFLLDHLPSRLHLFLLSRADPPLPLARLRARSQLVELRASDLRFSVEEAAEFLNLVMGLGLTGEQVAALEKRTEGWIAGLQLAALSMHGREDVDGFVSTFTGSNHYIVEYLVAEVLARQPEARRQFLLKTSILERFTGSLCDALTGEENGEEVLAELDHANLFIVPLDDEHYWYRFHHLFADLLRNHLVHSHPEIVPQLHGKAAAWLEEQGLISDAIRHSLAAGDWERVVRLISANVFALLEQSELNTLARQLENLTSEKSGARPWLWMGRAWLAAYTGQLNSVESILKMAEAEISSLASQVDQQTLRGHIAAIRAYTAWIESKWDISAQEARAALECLPATERLIRCQAATLLGLTLDDFNARTQAFEQALDYARESSVSHVTIFAHGCWAWNLATHGSLRQAHAACHKAIRLSQSSGSNQPLPTLSHVLTTLSFVLCEWNDLEGALRYSKEAVNLARRWEQADALHFALDNLGYALFAAGDVEGAFEVLRQAWQVARRTSAWFERISLTQEVEWYLAQGNLEAALQSLRLAHVDIEDATIILPNSVKSTVSPLTLIQILIAQKQFSKALTLSGHFLEDLENMEIDYFTVRVLTRQALAYHGLRQEAQALASLKRALTIAAPEGYVRSFIGAEAGLISLLQQARAAGIMPDYIDKLLSSVERGVKTQPAQTGTVTRLVESLSGRELEVLKLLAEGHSDKQIAETLVIARETVHKHLKNIYGKLGVHSRTEAIARARELDLL
jgi:LuxR family maltose regulon positive regulatory protein